MSSLGLMRGNFGIRSEAFLCTRLLQRDVNVAVCRKFYRDLFSSLNQGKQTALDRFLNIAQCFIKRVALAYATG